jgi:hypothetical protein
MRDVFVALNDLVLVRLAERGHGVIRPVHSAVFEHLDDTGTTVSVLAERAQMTKQAMAELVAHLEAHGYVVREPDPTDRRAKLVRPTELGREVGLIGPERVAALRNDLEILRNRMTTGREPPLPRPAGNLTQVSATARRTSSM